MAAISFEHAEGARAALREIVAHHGPDTLSDPAAMSNLLKDLLPDDPRIARLLVAAAEDRIAGVLREHVVQGLDGATAARLAASALAGTTMFTPAVCNWIVAEMAAAMGLLAEIPDPSASLADPIAPPLEKRPSTPPVSEAAAGSADVTAKRPPVDPTVPPIPAPSVPADPEDTTLTTAADGPPTPLCAPWPPTNTGLANTSRPARTRPKWLIPVVVTVAVLAAGGVGIATSLHAAANPPAVLRPTGLQAANQTFSSISLTWSKPIHGAKPTKYEVFQDGGLIGSVAGTAAAYLVDGLSPNQSYSFRLIAVRGRNHSPSSATLTTATATAPPVSAAEMSGPFNIVYSHPAYKDLRRYRLYPDHWETSLTCRRGPCSVRLSGQFQGYDFASTVLHRSGAVYTGRTTLKHYFTCFKQPVVGYLRISLKVTSASAFGSRWQATSLVGSFTATVPADVCTTIEVSAHVAGN